MTLDQLRREDTVQKNHLIAAVWLQDETNQTTATIRKIRMDCAAQDRLCGGKINSFDVLNKAVIIGGNIPKSDNYVGALREALNIVGRVMAHSQRGCH